MVSVYGVMPATSASMAQAAPRSIRRESAMKRAARTGWYRKRLGTDRTRSSGSNGR